MGQITIVVAETISGFREAIYLNGGLQSAGNLNAYDVANVAAGSDPVTIKQVWISVEAFGDPKFLGGKFPNSLKDLLQAAEE